MVELLLRVLGTCDLALEVVDSENLTVDFAGKLVDLICEIWSFYTLDLKIGFTFKGVFHADSDSVEDFGGSSAGSLSFGVLEGLFDNVDNFGWIWPRGVVLLIEGSSTSSLVPLSF